jgi:serine/threonine protein kinase
MYAIKKLRKEILTDKVLKAYFEREFDFISKLVHPNIIKFYSFNREHEYYVLEYVDYSLSSYFIHNEKHSQLLKDEVIIYLIVIQILKGLEYCHSEKISHRDIKPENILFNSTTCEVKLIDFNASKLVIGDENMTTLINTGNCKTEDLIHEFDCFEADKLKIDSPEFFYHFDIYCFGVLLYILSIGKNLTSSFNDIICLYQLDL